MEIQKRHGKLTVRFDGKEKTVIISVDGDGFLVGVVVFLILIAILFGLDWIRLQF